jgi:prepilin-type N-terminal cleavage/methylation domain-containing protein
MRGFTMIEILIVIALLGLLMLIAVPRYREMASRAENSAALSDLENLVRSEVAMLGDFQQYGRTSDSAAVAAHGQGVILIGPGTHDSVIANPSQFAVLGLSQGVHLITSTNAGLGNSFTAAAKHFRGTRIFAFDSNLGTLRQCVGSSNLSLAASGIAIIATSGNDLAATNGWQHL